MEPMEYKDTVDMMLSDDYKERMKAEYYQLKIRMEKLKDFILKIDIAEVNGEESPEHDCPVGLLHRQLHIMGLYLQILELRANKEGIIF